MAQVSIQATGRADLFWDLEESAAIDGLAVAMHRRTERGAMECVLPASTSDLIHVWNATRPKKGGDR